MSHSFTQATKVLDNVSIAAGGSANVEYGGGSRRVRVLIDASGLNVAVSLQSSGDGVTWHQVVAYAAGAVGAQAVVETCDARLRVRAANAGVGAQSATVWLVSQAD